MMLAVRTHNFGQIAVLRCSGRLMLGEDLGLLRRTVMSLLSERIVVLDLDGIDEIDACGVGVLVLLHNWTRDQHIELKLMTPAKHVQEVLELSGLQPVFDIWSGEDLAALLRGVAKPTCIHESESEGGRAA